MTADPPPGDRPRRRRRAPNQAAELPLEPVPWDDPSRPAPRPRAKRVPEPETGPAEPDLFAPRPETAVPAPPPIAVPEEPVRPHVPPPEIALQRVAPDALLRAGSKPDAYLYLVVGRAEADRLLRDGLCPDPGDPPRLVEKPALPALLSALEEEGGGLGGAVVLRLRAAAAAGLVEPDPDRRGGWLLSGGAEG